MDARVLDKIDRIVANAIHDKAMPGCQFLVARNGRVVFERSYGTFTYNEDIPVTSETLYDLASITKVIATLPAIMYLDESGIIDVDTKASWYLDDLRETNKANIIIRDILTHQAGLFPYLPLWKHTVDAHGLKPEWYAYQPEAGFNNQLLPGVYTSDALADSLWKWTLASPLVKKPLPKASYGYHYSDLGYYILKNLAEKYLNQPIDSFLIRNYYNPIGATRVTFLPLCRYPLSEIAPTAYDARFRKTLVHGTVHDQTAAMF
jgi:CubicO group peptidase (beta-lactamase class C family)